MFKTTMNCLWVALLLLFSLTATAEKGKTLKIDYEKYTLDNGLEVILHDDKSDPIASVAVVYHVGSNREETGRTGFAHLFEHMMFQESQHVGQDQFFKKVQGAGGTLNGFTTNDFTCYFEIVPKNALEMALWLESDRMGFLLSTVTEEAFKNQQEVVQNEKRQRVDNVPYGHTSYVIDKLLYPEDHPYNWQVIGSLEDLANATIDDVIKFFKKWYGPNNATLVIAGDLDKAQTKKWVEKYFGEIKAAPPVDDPKAWNVTLTETRRASHEDNFARSPELNMVFPTVQQFEKDAYALDLLSNLLSDGKKAPLYKVLVEEKKLAPSVGAFHRTNEITSYMRFRIRAFPDKNLTDVENAIKEAFALFEKEGFTDKDLARVKARTETDFYNGISSILNKSLQLAVYNEFKGSPDFISDDIQNSLDVTSEDIWRVYNKYIKDKHYVLTSFVPKGKAELIAENSEPFPIVEENILNEDGEATVAKSGTESKPAEKMTSSFDRSVEPPRGPSPETTVPEVWTHTYKNGLRIYGIENQELPLVEWALSLKGGLLLDDLEKVGVANLMTDIMMEGTESRTPLELEEAIDLLGSRINMFTGRESITIQANTLTSKLKDTYAIFEEILMEPRWDEKEFARIKDETIEGIKRQSVNPSTVSRNVYNKLIYGKQNILGYPVSGTEGSVAAITLDDLKAYYKNNYSPSVSYITIAGNISKADAVKLFSNLGSKWKSRDVSFPEFAAPTKPENSQLYFVDIPKAKQSQIRIGYLAMSYADPDYYPATVMNYKLGGSFNGNLNLILREEKGFTYGARSGFSGTHYPGAFTAASGVRSNATKESVEIFRDEMMKYREGISEDDMIFTRDALVQSNARRFETLGAKRGMLNAIANYGLDHDYIKQREEIVKKMTVEAHKALVEKYIDPNRMIYLLVGDAATQLEPLKELKLGDPILLDKDGEQTSL